MFDHVTLRVADLEASRRFYTLLLGEEPDHDEWDDFAMYPADPDHPPTTGLHIAFGVASPAAVDAAWRAMVDAGATSDGDPGPRREYGPDYYGGFLLDPDGNSAEVVHHDNVRTDGRVDHLWIRVADVAAGTAFYETIAPHAGLRVKSRRDALTQFAGSSGSFSVLRDDRPVTRNLHLAFPADSDEQVAAFHAAATGAGYRDNGAPGPRPAYHPGYVGAFVLDPDGNNVEVVNHNR